MSLVDVALGRGTVLVLALAVASWVVMPVARTHGGRVVVTETETSIALIPRRTSA